MIASHHIYIYIYIYHILSDVHKVIPIDDVYFQIWNNKNLAYLADLSLSMARNLVNSVKVNAKQYATPFIVIKGVQLKVKD